MKILLILSCCIFLYIPFNSFGQFENILVPSDLKQQTIITEPLTLRKGYIRAGIAADFINIDRLFDETGKKEYTSGINVYGKLWGYLPGIQYGITDHLQAFVRIPYFDAKYLASVKINAPLINFDTIISYKNKGRGFGDLETGINYQIIREKKYLPSVVLGTFVSWPTGRKNPENIKSDMEFDYPTGNGHAILASFLTLKKIKYPYSFTANLQYNYNFKGKKVMNPYEDAIEFKRGNSFALAAGFGFHLNDWIALLNDFIFWNFSGNTDYYSTVEYSPDGWTFDCRPAVYFQIRRFRFIELIQIPVFGRNELADPTYSFNLQYVL
jgi:hypothetical protein